MRIRLLLVVLFLISLSSVETATRTTMDNSAHDLSNESTDVSCLNCHWMHQRGSDKGYNHSLISEKTRYVCLVCHGGINPNSSKAPAYLTTSANQSGAPYLPSEFFRYKPVQYRGANAVYFSGQPGSTDVNIYNIEAEYQSAAAAPKGSYHMFFGSTYSAVTKKAGENIFSCFDCHNHGVYNTGYPGDRLPKLLWSKGAYLGISKDSRKNIDSCYATEYYCLSCHYYGYPEKWNDLPWNPAELLIDAVNFQTTKHSLLERYGVTEYGESRNPYGHKNDISCFVCHARHASTYPALMRENYDENTMCQQCHYGVTPKLSSTFAFTYRLENVDEPTVIYNYVTAGHIADKRWTTVYGHGKDTTSGGAGLKCSDCHGAHGTGHYKMVETTITNPRDGATYVLNASQISDLDNSLVSGFCGGSCHNLKSPDNSMEWWMPGAYYPRVESTKIFPMASSYRGKTVFDMSAHTTAVNLAIAQGYTLKACSGCHDSHGTENKALLWGSEEDVCFQCHNAFGGAKDIEKYFNTAKNGKSHHPVESAEQTDSSRVECINCHNPHLATKQYPTIYPYDWSVISDYSSAINCSGGLGVRDHENRAKFCATCHFVRFPYYVAPRYDSVLEFTYRGYYPPGVRIKGGKEDIANEWFSYYYDKYLVARGDCSGHYKSDSTCLIDCINCHNPHGSSNPSNIRDKAYQDPMSSYADNFVTATYNNFGAYDSFYNQNTQRSRKFCFSANGSSGCHLPQYLTTQVVFPDSLGVSTTHHNSRNVPYGDTAGSYYVDEHNPYWDTNTANAAPPSGVWGCSVCHYKAHNPTPNYWYNYSAKANQYCLDCHHPVESTSYNAATGKFFGGAPTKYESTYIEFCSAIYISKHLKSADTNWVTSDYCKDCHGEHCYDGGYTDQYHDVPGSFVSSPKRKAAVYLTDYLNGQSFCLACHRGGIEAFGTVAANMGVYNTTGHGRLSEIKVYCFDCHTKHASQNPHLLRTKIRDVITYPGVRDRNVRAEDLDVELSFDARYVSVKVEGYQSVCFACHSNPGVGRDSSEYSEINAKTPNPGTVLWLGEDVYKNSGHGSTYITPYAYVDTALFGATVVSGGGMNCSWCHEPHGRGADSNYAFNNTYNDDMLLREGNVSLCYRRGCHDTTLVAPGYTIANIKALFDTAASTHNISCLNCHNPHTGNKAKPVVIADYRTDMNAGEDKFCLSCHCEESKVPTYAHGNPPPDVDFPERSVSEEFFTGYDKSYYTTSAHGKKPNEVYCKTCHKPHGTNKLDLLREVYDFNQDGVFGEYSYDTVLTDTVTYGTAFVDYKEEEVCFGCHRNHVGESDWNPAWANIPDINGSFNTYPDTRHNVKAADQVGPDGKVGTNDDTRIECENCHNQHIATKEKPITYPDDPNLAMVAYGDEGIAFCISCHDNEPPPGIIGLTDEKYENIGAAYRDADNDGVYDSFTGHYRQRDGKPHECRLCHSMHGSNFSKQIKSDVLYDPGNDFHPSDSGTADLVRSMRPVRLPVTNPLGGNDTFFLSSTVEICLSCHSGRTEFYDGNEWANIPLSPPPQYISQNVSVAPYHPELLSTAASDYYVAFANGKKTVKSVYSPNMVNINDDTISKAGCSCHKAHNPYMAPTGELSNCYNCHDAIGGIETSFDTSKFIGGPAPLAHDDNTLLMLHLDGSYEGTSKELPVEGGKVGLRSVTGKYGLGVSFETAFATTKLVYPLWTSKATGAPGQHGIQHNETTDLTIRFDSTCDDEDAKGGIYRNSCSCSTGVDYSEGYIPGMYGAARLDTSDMLTYYSTASAYELSPRANINISNGSFVAWIEVEEPRNGYIFLHATNDVYPYKNAIFLRHSSINTWDIGVSDETGTASSIVSTEDELTVGWHHIAGTWSKTNRQLKLYIDGRLTASEGAQFFPSSTAETFRIGPISACIDEVQVSNYTKTDEEILEDYDCQNEMNFNPRRGTLAFWVKPYWNGSDQGNHTFFENYYDENNYFLLHKVDVAGYPGRLKGTVVGQGVQRDVYDFINMPAGVWAHIAISWDSSRMNLYLNGERIDDSTYTATMMGNADTAIYFGSRKDGTQPVRAVMDEIWITDVMLDSSTIYGIYGGNNNIVIGPITDPSDGYLHYEGGSRHPINYNIGDFEASDRKDVSKMECLKCHLQLESSHMEGVVKFVNVDSSMDWAKRVEGYNDSTRSGVTLFCLSCHMNPKADPLDGKYVGVTNSPYRFTGSGGVDPVQLRPLEDGKPKQKQGGGYYYPIDTASAHFDTSLGAGAFGDLSCTDCHDPHGSINKSMLQDFEEAKEGRDYNRDGIMTREIQYFDRENVRLYQLNEEKFCYWCHGGVGKDKGKFNGDGMNRGWQMKDIEGKFAHSGAHHMVDDEEQAENDVRIECTSCHNPHTARRDAVVLNPQTGERAYVASADQMNSFCIGCHGDSTISPVILTGWCEGVKFPGLDTNEVAPEWSGGSWNEFNKQPMSLLNQNKHFGDKIACAACHDPHGTSNYRMLCETGGVYGLKLMLQTKPDGRERYEVYSTAGYSINKFCFRCHINPRGQDPYYPRGYVYPGETAYAEWDFGIVDSSSKYDSLTKYDSIASGDYKYMAPDIYGKDKDCDYCHNPHSPDSVRESMIRDNVPQDLDRNSPNYGDKVDKNDWFQEGFPATGIDFCLSKGCHVTNRFAKLGPRDPNYTPGGDSNWWFKPYDQFDLSGKLPFSNIRDSSFIPDKVKYDSARSSKHPIVPYGEFEHHGNTLVCLSCHTPHGSPGNTELAKVYGSNYEPTYPQDNAGLRRAYYRRIYWWPVTFWKRGEPLGSIVRSSQGSGKDYYSIWDKSFNDVYGNPQNARYMAPFLKVDDNAIKYAQKSNNQDIPSAANDLCFMCHRKEDVIGTSSGIDTSKTRFVGHEAVVDGSRIGITKFGSGSLQGGGGLNKGPSGTGVPNDYHKFTCSVCHGPHAATNEKLLTQKCFAYNYKRPADVYKGLLYRESPQAYCHPYDNSGQNDNWNNQEQGGWHEDMSGGYNYVGWRKMIDTTRTDFDRPVNSIDTLYTYFNTTKVYDTSIAIPGLNNFKVTSSDLDVVLSWRSVRDSAGDVKWAHHYNVYRGETTLTQQNKSFKSLPIKTWEKWGYSLVDRVLDTSDLKRADTSFSTLYTIDPSFAHTVGKKYFYMVVPADAVDNEAIVAGCQDTAGVSFAVTDVLAPRPITAISLAQETYKDGEEYKYRMRFTWQDAGDNLATKNYTLYCNSVDTSAFSTAQMGTYFPATSFVSMVDTSFNTDIIATTNFSDCYSTTHEISLDQKKVYILWIKSSDNQNNNTTSVKYVRMTDSVPALITDLKAIPSVTANLSNEANNNYNVVLSWSVPYDNNPPIPRYKVYRRLDKPMSQLDIDDYNLKDTALTDVECCCTALVSSAVSGKVYWTDNVEPNKVYYYAVTSVDKYATTTSNRADTAYGYQTDHVGWLYREQMMPCHNTKLLDPFDGQMKPAKTNTHFSFSFIGADYETAYFKKYNFYYRYNTDKVWKFGASTDTLNHGNPNPSICWASGCHPSQISHGDTTQCISCHPGNARGGLNLSTSDPVGDYYFAGSIVYNSVGVVIDGEPPTWIDNLESPLNEVAMMNVTDLTPPSPLTLSASLVPTKENGYDSVKLSWSGGTDAVNFKNYKIKYHPEMTGLSSDWVVQDTLNNMYESTWTRICPAPETTWQTTNTKYGDFVYRYELWAWDSADNYSSASVRISTRPPSDGLYSPFGLRGESGSAIKLTWQNMYQYSYSTDYTGATGYNIYAGETRIGTVPAVIDVQYPTANQVISAGVSASSSLFSATSANDENLSTFWKAASYDTFSTTFIEFDLGVDKPVIASIVYNNSLAHLGSTDTTQGYTILVSADTNPPVWKTVVTKLPPTPRCETRYEWSDKTKIRYIRVTGFSPSDYDLTELMAYCPTNTSTTFVHSYNNQYLRALPGHNYDYRIYLEDNTGAQSLSTYSLTYSAVDTEKPFPVVDLVAFWSSMDSTIHLKWSRPYDNIGVAKYEIWRREGNSDILDGENKDLMNVQLSSTCTTEVFVDDPKMEMSPYWYAVSAVDSTGNRSDFDSTDYSACAYKGVDRDTIPPEPVALESYSYSVNGADAEVTLNWEQGSDRRDYDTAGQADTTLYAVGGYNIYRSDIPFANVAKSFDSCGVFGITKVIADTDNSAKKLVVYNCVGNPREELVNGGAYIKSTGYAFETSAHYVFGIWLRAEGQFSTTYAGDVRLDVVGQLARRTLIKPCNNWTYYMLNFVAIDSNLSDTVMIWANSNGTIWLDSARLVYLGVPKAYRNNPVSTWYDSSVRQDSTYYYAVTSVDDYDNEGDFASSLRVVCKESGPVFDSVPEWIVDPTPENPMDTIKTGTTPTICLVTGEYDVNDNMFREGERIVLKFKIKDVLTGEPDSTILDMPGCGRINGIIDGVSYDDKWGVSNGGGYYTFHYIIKKIPEEKVSTRNPEDGTWMNLSRIEVKVTNKTGNGPAVDTTYQCILDPNPTESVK